MLVTGIQDVFESHTIVPNGYNIGRYEESRPHSSDLLLKLRM
jgi:hypothetical protein